MNAMNEGELAKLVDKALRDHRDKIGNYEFRVPPELIRQEDESWYVVIVPDKEVGKKSEYYDVLNQIEEELESQQHLDVMLVPVTPERD